MLPTGDGKRVFTVEDGVTTLYIGDYFEAELGEERTDLETIL